MRLAIAHSTVRSEEKLLLQVATELGLDVSLFDVRAQTLNPQTWRDSFDVVLERCVSGTLGWQVTLFFESLGVPVVNSSRVAATCADKFATSLVLRRAGVPTPRFAVAFNLEKAEQAVEQLGGYPVVVKPVQGSWGRLVARVNDRHALEAIIEHKHVLGSPLHKPIYLQQFIAKPDRDIRVTMVGEKVVCAIYRSSQHWITNTANGAQAETCRLTPEIRRICLDASQAVGGGVLGIDLFETDQGPVVNEVNHTTEFKNVQRVTGVDVARHIVEYCTQLVAQPDLEATSQPNNQTRRGRSNGQVSQPAPQPVAASPAHPLSV